MYVLKRPGDNNEKYNDVPRGRDSAGGGGYRKHFSTLEDCLVGGTGNMNIANTMPEMEKRAGWRFALFLKNVRRSIEEMMIRRRVGGEREEKKKRSN